MKRLFLILAVCLLVVSCSCNPAPKTADRTPEAVSPPPLPPPPKEVIEAVGMLDYWQDDRDPDRRNAAVLLGLYAHPHAVDPVNSHLLADRDPLIRATCAWAAGKIADIRSMPQLQKALDDPDQRVRLAAISALARFDDPDSRDSLIKIIRETGGVEGMAAFAALGTMPGADIAALPRPGRSRGRAAWASAGRTFFVDASAGQDGNPGTESAPVKTLAKGISLLSAGRGDTLFATSGARKLPFREKAVIGPDQSGLPGAPTALRAWPGKPEPMIFASEPVEPEPGDDLLVHAAIGVPVLSVFLIYPDKTLLLDPVTALDRLVEGSFFYDETEKSLILLPPKSGLAGAKIEACVRDDGISVEKAHFIMIEGFTVAYAQDTGIDFANAHQGVIRNAIVHDCDRHGIFFFYSPFGTVLDSEVFNCRYQGISIRSSPSTVVHGCFCHDNGQDGVLFLYDSDGCTVSRCRVEGNKRGIGFIEGSDLGRVFANSFKDNGANVDFDPSSFGRLLDKGEP